MSDASDPANGRASGPVLQSVFVVFLAHSAWPDLLVVDVGAAHDEIETKVFEMLVKKLRAAQRGDEVTQKGIKFGQFGRKRRSLGRVNHVSLLDRLCMGR